MRAELAGLVEAIVAGGSYNQPVESYVAWVPDIDKKEPQSTMQAFVYGEGLSLEPTTRCPDSNSEYEVHVLMRQAVESQDNVAVGAAVATVDAVMIELLRNHRITDSSGNQHVIGQARVNSAFDPEQLFKANTFASWIVLEIRSIIA